MIELNENDEKLWESIWPWGFVWTLTVMISMAASEYFLKANTAQFGKLFYALLIVPFAWHGYDWYAKYLCHRLVNLYIIRLLTNTYLVMVSCAMILTLREWNYSIFFIIVSQTIITVYTWSKHLEDICDIIQIDDSDMNEHWSRYFYDIALFVLPVALVFMFN